jgi:molybdopterin/thiamine biosynthesis adenylyltransferase
MDKSYSTRFQDAIWFPKGTTVDCIVGGAGGIGSWLTLFLTRAGFSPYVFDFDTLEAHNLGGQMFSMMDIGQKKVHGLREIILQMTNENIDVSSEEYNKDSETSDFVFSAFDNMQARATMFHKWNEYVQTLSEEDKKKAIFIDGRLLAEQLQIFAITGDNEKHKEDYTKIHLFKDSEVEDASCSFKQTTHVAALIASLMTSTFTNHLANIAIGRKARSVPFYMEYFVPLHLQTTDENQGTV